MNSFAGPFSLVSSPKRCGSIRDHEARVLIIHGQPEVRKVLVDELTSSGCRTFEAMSRADGLPLFHQVKPDLILLEGRPDRKDDLETISRIRRFAEIPVIVLVDHGSEFDGQSPRVENVTFFAPPFRIKEVVAEAKRLCESQENSSRHAYFGCIEKGDNVVSLHVTNRAQILAIDRALRDIGDTGEIRLIVHRGHLRFLEKIKTEALRPEPVCV